MTTTRRFVDVSVMQNTDRYGKTFIKLLKKVSPKARTEAEMDALAASGTVS